MSSKTPKIIRDKKGHIKKGIAQATNKNGTAGSPCMLCNNKEEILKTTTKYIEQHLNSESKSIPFIEELALILKVHRGTIGEWAAKEEHPEFASAFHTIQDIQRLRLQQRVLGRYNPTGAIYLMKVNHKMIEESKQILAGDSREPLEITITEERPINE